MKFEPLNFHRRSIRLEGYDYSQTGAYFVTIDTFQHECLFGEIVDGAMRLNAFGRVVRDCWGAIPEHFPDVELGAYVVMPNHVHGIIVIHEPDKGTTSMGTASMGTIYRAHTTVERFGKPTKGSLPTIVRTYKAAVTRKIGQKNIWHRN